MKQQMRDSAYKEYLRQSQRVEMIVRTIVVTIVVVLLAAYTWL